MFRMPMALPLEARLPDAQVKRARQALARAKLVGEEYNGVQVATASVRARRAGQAIVEEARRRGVEAIVLGAEEPSRIRAGRASGAAAGGGDFVGDVSIRRREGELPGDRHGAARGLAAAAPSRPRRSRG